MAEQAIQSSVGRGATNRRGDVIIVQKLLIGRGFGAGGQADGICGNGTINAIVAYQTGFMRTPDGRVDPGGNAWRHLTAQLVVSTEPAPTGGDSLTRQVPRPAPGAINVGLTAVSNDYMFQKLGRPRSGNYPTDCSEQPTDARLRRNIVTDTVGPFRVSGLKPAVLSLKEVMGDIEKAQPAVYRALGTQGMLCVRLQRGSTTAVSNHSWGTAIDLTINGILDVYGNDTVQYGLTLIAPIFNRHGWYWGAAFRKEDGMHFEGSKALIDQWAQQLT